MQPFLQHISSNFAVDNVCIDSMSVKINRRTIERSTTALNKLEAYVKE